MPIFEEQRPLRYCDFFDHIAVYIYNCTTDQWFEDNTNVDIQLLTASAVLSRIFCNKLLGAELRGMPHDIVLDDIKSTGVFRSDIEMNINISSIYMYVVIDNCVELIFSGNPAWTKFVTENNLE